MFKDELTKKLEITVGVLPFALTMMSRTKTVISGVKNVLFMSENSIKMRISGGQIEMMGKGLKIVEIGGGDAYVKGEIESIKFE